MMKKSLNLDLLEFHVREAREAEKAVMKRAGDAAVYKRLLNMV